MSAMANGSTNRTAFFRGISWQTTHKIHCHCRDATCSGRDMALQINGNLNAGSTAWPDNNKWNLKVPHYWDILVRIFRLTLLGSSNCSTSFQNIMVQYIHPLGLYPSFSIKHNLDIMHKHYIFCFKHFVFNIAPEYTEWRLIYLNQFRIMFVFMDGLFGLLYTFAALYNQLEPPGIYFSNISICVANISQINCISSVNMWTVCTWL